MKELETTHEPDLGAMVDKLKTAQKLNMGAKVDKSETTQKLDLGKIIDKFADETLTADPTRVVFSWIDKPAVKRVNVALQKMGDGQRIEFLKAILNLWDEACYHPPLAAWKFEELRKVFGDQQDEWLGLHLMFTLTQNGKEFRCWYGLPHRIEQNHVDGCGEGELFGVCGEKANVLQYVDSLISPQRHQKVITLPNGVQVWGLDWHWEIRY